MQALLYWLTRLLIKPQLAPGRTLLRQRLAYNGLRRLALAPRSTQVTRTTVAGLPIIHSQPNDGGGQRAVLYLEGGNGLSGTKASQRMARALSKALNAHVWATALPVSTSSVHDQPLTIYLALLKALPDQQPPILIGHGLGAAQALSLAVSIHEAGQPLPTALALLSPWLDMGLTGYSLRSHALRDPLISVEQLRHVAASYCGAMEPTASSCSPLFADLRSLPALLIQVGSEEMLLSDALRLHKAARNAAVESKLSQFPHLWHGFHHHHGLLRASDLALQEIHQFIAEQQQPLQQQAA